MYYFNPYINIMKTIKLIIAPLAFASLVFLAGCGNDDDGPDAVTLVGLEATGTSLETGESITVDLNAATTAENVPVDATFTATFSRELDPETVNSSSFTLTVDGTAVPATVSASGDVVTATATEGLIRGTDYSVALAGTITASDGGSFAETSRVFKTDGVAPVTPPQQDAQVVYWNFDGNANDVLGSVNPTKEVSIDYQEDRFGQTASTAYFDGDVSIIEYPNGSSLMDSEDFTISFWLKTETEGHVNADGNPTGMFVFGLGAFMGIQYEIFGSFDGSKFAIGYENDAGETFSEDMWFPNGATDNSNGGWQGWTFAKSLSSDEMKAIIMDNWYHVIYSFDGSERVGSLYFNGELMKSFDFDLWPDDAPKKTASALKYRGMEPDVLNEFALGFIHSSGGVMWDDTPWGSYETPTANHFKGWLDDFRIFHAAYSAAEAKDLHDAEKP